MRGRQEPRCLQHFTPVMPIKVRATMVKMNTRGDDRDGVELHR